MLSVFLGVPLASLRETHMCKRVSERTTVSFHGQSVSLSTFKNVFTVP